MNWKLHLSKTPGQAHLTLDAGQVIKFAADQAKSFKSSLGAELCDMSDEELQTYMCPTEDDYVRIPVRMLTATGVQNNTINFGHLAGQPLKEAVPLFNSLTILKDHIFSVDNWMGKTENCFWDSTTPGAPAGVTGVMRLDKKADPKTCRGLISGDLSSVSVTIQFEYDKSHPKMSDYDFYCKLGEVVDGQTVQALVTKVNRVYELSIVWQGADQFAKTLDDDGNIVVPGTNSNSLTQHNTKEVSVDPKKLAALLGLKLEGDAAPTEESITQALQDRVLETQTLQTKLTAAETTATELTAKVVELSAQVETIAPLQASLDTLKAEMEPLKAQAELGKTTLANTRNEALRLYNLVEDKKATKTLQDLISGSSLDVAQSFIDSYRDKAEQVAPLKCTKCGCTELSRQQGKQPDTQEPTAKSDMETERLKTSVSSIHG